MMYEWNVLRAIACLSIVLLHATTNTEIINGYIENPYYQFFRLLLCFATPTFILLSIIILAKRYPVELPPNFLWRRFQFVYIPFVAASILYAIYATLHYDESFWNALYRHIVLGDFSGWFVMTIFQLYILFFIIKKYQLSSIWLTPIMLALGILYMTLAKLNVDFSIVNDNVVRLLFVGWLPFFAIAYLIGTHYRWVALYISKYKFLTLVFVVLSTSILAINYYLGATEITSRRLDMMLLIISITLCILAFGQIAPKLKIINLVSQYSFGIFLIHWLVQEFLVPYTAQIPTTSLQVIALFLSSVIVCMLIIKIISFLPYSAYLIGKAHIKKPSQ
ncbi:acyltransferase family protein [Lysinibacillus xylanilyticus]|uniref:acyltransferase family protein n=1 Tax=Lysinibacillus xylanilyticus TaxID=582475 RepID=UPI0038069803